MGMNALITFRECTQYLCLTAGRAAELYGETLGVVLERAGWDREMT
jgi:hypothetical protein